MDSKREHYEAVQMRVFLVASVSAILLPEVDPTRILDAQLYRADRTSNSCSNVNTSTLVKESCSLSPRSLEIGIPCIESVTVYFMMIDPRSLSSVRYSYPCGPLPKK